MTPWVCGGTGLLGRAIGAEFERRGVDALCTGRATDARDLRVIRRFLDAHPVDTIVNCVGWTGVDQAEVAVDQAVELNALVPRLLATEAAERGLRLVHVSTDYVFDGVPGRPLTEADRPAPLNVYGRTKLAGEEAVRHAFPEALVVRTSWLYGAHGPNFVRTMLRLFGERDDVAVVEDQWGRPTHTRSLARAVADLSVGSLRGVGGLIHYADAGATTWHGLATRVLEVARREGIPLRATQVRPVSTAEFPRAATRPAWSVLDTQKMESMLAWTIPPWQVELADHVRHMIRSSS